MTQVLLALRWYLVVQAFGLAALPLCLALLRHLPDRGYGVSKPLGLLVAGWLFWLLTTFGWTYNTAGGILVALALLVAVGLSLTSSLLPLSFQWLREHWRVVLVTECLFALAFAAWCLVRAHMPCIETAGGEKWMEIAFLRAILRSRTFPPHDPWLSGFAISYYYFGYVIVAMLTRLAAVPPPVAFNLGIATLFGLASTGAFSLAFNLIHAGREETDVQAQAPQWRWQSFLGGLSGSLLVTVMGNLGGLLEMLHARGVGPAAFWAWLDVRGVREPPPPFVEGSWEPRRFFWWWSPSRVIQDYTPWGDLQEVIDEFPAFSFILGDMHPHVLALPFVLLTLSLAFNLYLRVSRAASAKSRGRFSAFHLTLWELFVYAVCLGGLGFLNTWDFPIYLFVVVASCALARLRLTPDVPGMHFGLLFGFLLVTGVLLYLPFWIGFQSQAGGLLFNLFNATRLPQFVVMFGPLIFIASAFVFAEARRRDLRPREVIKWTLLAIAGAAAGLAFVLGLVLTLVRLGVLPSRGAVVYLSAWLRGGPIPGLEGVSNARALIADSLLSRLLNPWTAVGLIAFLIAIALLLRNNLPDSQSTNFVLLLFAVGALLTLTVEFVYLRDNFGTRMNTVFKFYFQAWVMWGVAGAYALTRFIRRRGWAAIVALLLVAAGMVYPVLAIRARAREYGAPPTLDGTKYLAHLHPHDYAAIAWLNDNVDGAPVILEAPADRYRAYVYEGRVSAHTGLPTLLGWAGHEHQWRGNYEEQARREPDIETLYTSTDPAEILTLMDEYDVSYVYVGPVERERYPSPGLAKFAGLLDVVYDTGEVTIYRLDR